VGVRGLRQDHVKYPDSAGLRAVARAAVKPLGATWVLLPGPVPLSGLLLGLLAALSLSGCPPDPQPVLQRNP